MGYTRMTDDEWRAFLLAPVRPAVLAVVRKDGRPHATPVWYDLDDDGTVLFTTHETSAKGRAVQRDGRVTLCVQDDRPPFSYVMVEGSATVDRDLDAVRRWAGRIGGRYMGADEAEAYGERNGVPGEVLVRVTPTRVVAIKDVAL